MARDTTVEERIETILYHFGIRNSGDIAKAIYEELKEDLIEAT